MITLTATLGDLPSPPFFPFPLPLLPLLLSSDLLDDFEGRAERPRYVDAKTYSTNPEVKPRWISGRWVA